MGSRDDGLDRVVELVGAAEVAVESVDVDPAAGWGMVSAERLEVTELLDQLGYPLPDVPPRATEPVDGASAFGGTAGHTAGGARPVDGEPADPASLYEKAADAAAALDPATTPPGLLMLLVQALSNAAATARSVQAG